ncbi:MAG: hypothetical protein RL726_1084, partial [Actinomycetota bacterium]
MRNKAPFAALLILVSTLVVGVPATPLGAAASSAISPMAIGDLGAVT